MAKRSSSRGAKGPYSVHPSVAMVRDWIDSLPAKTGRSLEQWLQLIRTEGPPDAEGRRAWLKANHGMGTNQAWWFVERVDGGRPQDDDPEAYLQAAAEYVETMYSGPKASHRPIHDRLLESALGLGDDVRVCPCTTTVPLFRRHVFAQIKPSTRTRIDLGLALKGADYEGHGRLIDTGGLAKKDRITHRIALGSADEIDAEVIRWLRTAYELDRA